jgi:hypothetical protein
VTLKHNYVPVAFRLSVMPLFTSLYNDDTTTLLEQYDFLVNSCTIISRLDKLTLDLFGCIEAPR